MIVRTGKKHNFKLGISRGYQVCLTHSGVAVLVLAINVHLLDPAYHSADAIACVQPHLPGLGTGDDKFIQLQHPLVITPL